MGEDAPLDNLPLRNMADPTLTPLAAQPDRMTSYLYQADLFFTDGGAVQKRSRQQRGVPHRPRDGGRDRHTRAFNGQTVTGIGIAKASKLYLRVQQMLTSGSDYADLGGVLAQACSDLTGTSGFTATDCTNVRKAVTATEMATQPIGPAAAPEAGYCPTGSRDTFAFDGFETPLAERWTLGGQWARIGDYARTGTYSIYGVEPD